MGRPRVPMIGKVFGRLTVQSYSHASDHGHPVYLCICACGNYHLATGGNIRRNTRSCGCLPRPGNLTHGHARNRTKTPEYQTWRGMHARCTDPKNSHYKYYGARGVKVCKRWKSLQAFFKDMGPRPKGKTLDRWPDPRGDYKPSNCRWATARQQLLNGRSKLQIKDIRNIKRRLAAGERQVDIAADYPVGPAMISHIATGLSWGDVE